jgi:glucose-6-phosphate 1-dehydrogenase
MMNAMTFILFGSTGDLAKRKIFPALFNLFRCHEKRRLSGTARHRIRAGKRAGHYGKPHVL